MCGWRSVEQEGRIQFSLLDFCALYTEIQVWVWDTLAWGSTENLCGRSAFDFAISNSVLFFLVKHFFFFHYKSDFLVQGWGSLFCGMLEVNMNDV